jgi:uroporphyrinogen-III synthase
MRLIVTRPVEDALPLKQKLEALGHQVVLSPVLVIAPLSGVVIEDRPYASLIFTSANAIRAIAAHPLLTKLKKIPAHVVGPQSAQAAEAAGFNDVRVAGGSADTLARHMIATLDPNDGTILYISGRDSAVDLAGRLRTADFAVNRVIAYEAQPAASLSPGVKSGADGVLLYSPRSARIWVELVERDGLGGIARAMPHLCISTNAAAALPQTYVKRIASESSEEAMLALVAVLAGECGLA